MDEAEFDCIQLGEELLSQLTPPLAQGNFSVSRTNPNSKFSVECNGWTKAIDDSIRSIQLGKLEKPVKWQIRFADS